MKHVWGEPAATGSWGGRGGAARGQAGAADCRAAVRTGPQRARARPYVMPELCSGPSEAPSPAKPHAAAPSAANRKTAASQRPATPRPALGSPGGTSCVIRTHSGSRAAIERLSTPHAVGQSSQDLPPARLLPPRRHVQATPKRWGHPYRQTQARPAAPRGGALDAPSRRAQRRAHQLLHAAMSPNSVSAVPWGHQQQSAGAERRRCGGAGGAAARGRAAAGVLRSGPAGPPSITAIDRYPLSPWPPLAGPAKTPARSRPLLAAPPYLPAPLSPPTG